MIRRATIITIACALLLGYLIWYMAIGPDSSVYSVGVNVIQCVAGLFAVLVLYRRSRSTIGASKSNPWFYYTLGVSFYFAAQLYWTLHLVFYGREPSTWGLPELLWIAQYVFYIIALRYHFQVKNKRYPFTRFYLDNLIFTICAVALYWHYFLVSSLSEPIYANGTLILNFICSGFSAGILFGLVVLSLYERVTEYPHTIALLIIAFGWKAVANISALHLVIQSPSSELLRQVPDLFLVASMAFFGLAGSTKSGMPPADRRRTNHSVAGKVRQYLPFFLIVVMVFALFFGIRKPNALLIGTSLTIVFLLIRLWISRLGYLSAERALSEAERKYRSLVENSQVGVFSAHYGKLTYVNRYFANTFDYLPEEMVGTSFLHYFAGEDRQKLAVEISRLGMNQGFTSHIAVKGIKKDGSSVHLEVQVTRTVNQGDDVVITGTLLDITERRLAEEVVIRSEKLSVVGQLAAGVAHEIRNPLTSLRGFTQLLKARSDNKQDTDYYDIMLTELDRINYIVGEFMLLSKPQQMQQLETHDLHELLGSMLPIIETQAIIHNVMIDVDWKTAVHPVLCDKNQIKQVFMNVLKNAIEAMTSGGTIRIRFYENRNGYSCIQFADEGPGMPQEVLNRLGEPFFSTKNTGTGLGLMVCYRIIEAHHGKMKITSETNRGTTVEIQLKSTAKEARDRGMYI